MALSKVFTPTPEPDRSLHFVVRKIIKKTVLTKVVAHIIYPVYTMYPLCIAVPVGFLEHSEKSSGVIYLIKSIGRSF